MHCNMPLNYNSRVYTEDVGQDCCPKAVDSGGLYVPFATYTAFHALRGFRYVLYLLCEVYHPAGTLGQLISGNSSD